MGSQEPSWDYFVASAARVEQNLHDNIGPCHEEFLNLKEAFSEVYELGQFSQLFSPQSWETLSSFQRLTRTENNCRLLQKEFGIERTALVESFDDRALGAETFTTKLLQFCRLAGFHNALSSITAAQQERLQRKRRKEVQTWKTSDISQAMALWVKDNQEGLESHEQDDEFQGEIPEDGLAGGADQPEEEDLGSEEEDLMPEEEGGGPVQEIPLQDEASGSPTQKEMPSSSANSSTISGSTNDHVAVLSKTLDSSVTTSRRRKRVETVESVS